MEDIFHEEFLLEKDENISDTEYDLKQLLLEANLKVKKVPFGLQSYLRKQHKSERRKSREML